MKYTYLFLLSFFFICCGGEKLNSSNLEWINNQTIYEVNLRQYTAEGTFASFRKHLPRLKGMGVGVLWFMPIHPIGEKNRKGELGSYYSVRDYLDINPEFGTKKEFKSLIDEIHKMGMYVIIDWVANHTACDNAMVSENPNWYTRNKSGDFQPPQGTDWSDVYDLDFSSPDLRSYMAKAMGYWVKEFDIDGFRCDVAGMVPTDFWETTINKLGFIKPIFMLAEWEDPELLDKGFQADYSWQLYHILKDVSKGNKKVADIRDFYENPKKKYPEGALKMNFLDNHDENSWNRVMVEHFKEKVYPLSTMLFTLPGIPMIYSGQESRLNKRLKFFEKDTIDWGAFSDENFYKKLISLRKVHPAFWSDNTNLEFLNNYPEGLIGYKRWDDENTYHIILNLSNEKEDLNKEVSHEILIRDKKSSEQSISPNGFVVYKILNE